MNSFISVSIFIHYKSIFKMRLLTILLLLGVTLTCEGLQIQSLYTQNNTPIPVNYSFNETLHPSISKYSSAPGCPTSIDGYPFLQYESFLDDEHSCQFNELKGPCPAPHPRKEVLCYLAGFQGPCPSSNEVLLPSNSSWPLGQCACSCSNYTTYKTKGFCLNPLNKRIIVLIPHLGRCYPLFEQVRGHNCQVAYLNLDILPIRAPAAQENGSFWMAPLPSVNSDDVPLFPLGILASPSFTPDIINASKLGKLIRRMPSLSTVST